MHDGSESDQTMRDRYALDDGGSEQAASPARDCV